MKKLLLCALLFSATASFAQNFQLGLKAGVNVSNFTGGNFNTVKHQALVGFHGGGFIRYKFGGFAIQPELLFSSQGAKLDSAGTKQNYKISYVNIPIMLQYETQGGFYIEAGPQVGFKVNEDVPNTTIGTFAKNSDLAVDFGLGYHSKAGLGIGARYDVGVSKVGDFNAGSFDPNFHNGVLQLSVFFTLFNNKK